MASAGTVTKVVGTLEIEIDVQNTLGLAVIEDMFMEAIAQALGVSIEDIVELKVSEVTPASGLRRLQEVQTKRYEVSYEVLPPSYLNPFEVVEKANRIASADTTEAQAFQEVLLTTDGVSEVGQITSKISAFSIPVNTPGNTPGMTPSAEKNGSIAPLVVGSIVGSFALLCVIGVAVMVWRKTAPDRMKITLCGSAGGDEAEFGNPVVEVLPYNTLLRSGVVQPQSDIKKEMPC
jgi:hypothetical protein